MNLSADSKKFLSKLSTNELSELGAIRQADEALIQNLSPEQFESLVSEKNDKLDQTTKDKITTVRYAPLRSAVQSGVGADIKKVLNSLSKGEREKMPADIVSTTALLDNLSDKQREELRDSKHRTATERQSVKDSSPVNKFEALFDSAGAAQAAAALQSDLKPKQVAKLKRTILTDPLIVAEFNGATLMALQEEDLSAGDISTIAGHIRNGQNPALKKYIRSGPGAAYWS